MQLRGWASTVAKPTSRLFLNMGEWPDCNHCPVKKRFAKLYYCSCCFQLPHSLVSQFPSHSKAPHYLQCMDLNGDTDSYSLNKAHPLYVRKAKAGKKLTACGYIAWLWEHNLEQVGVISDSLSLLIQSHHRAERVVQRKNCCQHPLWSPKITCLAPATCLQLCRASCPLL